MIYLFLLLFLLWLPIHLYFPKPNTKLHQADCILVLGCPTRPDGSLCRTQIRRCNKAFSLYQAGYAPTIMISGGAAHNAYCEAREMAKYLHTLDPHIPINEEDQANNTYDNFCYAKQLCVAHGFHSLLVVTSTSHLRRSAYFARKFFTDFAMIQDDEPFSLKKYSREFFAFYNTLYYELKLKHK